MKANKMGGILVLALALLPQLGAQGNPGGNALTEEEKTRLMLMREEEKMAGDVYRLLGEKWNLRIFRNIASSEDNHFKQVGKLLDRYGLPDPASTQSGVFADSRLGVLYQELVTKGTRSIQEALEVGVLIEKVDIDDLVKGIMEAKQPDIKRVYTNLLNASFNHLESFETTLEVIAPKAP